MEYIHKTKLNTSLRQERLLRGWSLRDVVDQLCKLCEEDDDIPGVTPDMVSKWERGERKPSRFYQGKLCLLYSKTADQLGFLEAQNEIEFQASNVTLSYPVPEASANTRTLDMLLNNEPTEVSEALATHILSLSSQQLATLTHLGWTQQEIIKTLQVVLQGDIAMANMNRRRVLQLGSSMLLLGGTGIPTHEHLTIGEQTQLAQALVEGNIAGWTLFHTAGTAQVLAVSQSQLTLIQQTHSTLHPNSLPFLYSGAYRLMGAALYFQERYQESLRFHQQAYQAAKETHDAWNIAQSLSWLAYVYQERGQYQEAIQVIEHALHLITHLDDEAHLRLKGHLLACWAEDATLLHKKSMAQEKLEMSAALLDRISPNEEFDRTKWLQHAGKIALETGDYTTAIRHLEEALPQLQPNWTLSHAVTLMPLAKAYIGARERDASLATVKKAVPVIQAMKASIINKQFAELIHRDLLNAYPDDQHIRTFVADTLHQVQQISR